MQSSRLLDQLREQFRHPHYSLSTERTYRYWIRFFARWHGRSGTMTHPRDMGAKKVEAFLTMLATERRVSASTPNLTFFDRQVIIVREAKGNKE